MTTSISHPPGPSRTYIVRIWPEPHGLLPTPDGTMPTYRWRASVLHGVSGERHSFADLHACLQHLHDDWMAP